MACLHVSLVTSHASIGTDISVKSDSINPLSQRRVIAAVVNFFLLDNNIFAQGGNVFRGIFETLILPLLKENEP